MGVLKGKVALVTGGGSGIGRGICLRFARDHADVVVNDIDIKSIKKVSREVKSLGAKSLGICADVSLKPLVEEMVSRIIKKWKKIDILVNCAGIARISPLIETTEEEFDRVYEVNLKGTFLCTQIVAKHMIKQGEGKIINISSLAGRRPAEFLAAYGASKFGVIGLTQTTALELAKYGITCNAVAPGFIDTPLSTLRDQREAEIRGVKKIDTLARGVKNVALGRAGTAEDIAKVVSFLAGPDADYVNGQTINVCGGAVFS
jgi:NAD(P)-dependent dehydrogenase (short-subunit alcohol dehydrogenase family)